MIVLASVTCAGCYCSHVRGQDAGALPDVPVVRDGGTDAGPRYSSSLECDDPELWDRVPTAGLAIEVPFECVPFHEPVHAFQLWPRLDSEPERFVRACWRVIEDDQCGWSPGEIVESADPPLVGYVRGGCRAIELEARVQMSDGRLLAGDGRYEARLESTSAIESGSLDAPPIAVLFGGHADASGLHWGERHVRIDGLVAAGEITRGYATPAAAWVSEGTARTLGLVYFEGDVERRLEAPIDPGGTLRFAVSGRRDPVSWAVAVVGSLATVMQLDPSVPSASHHTFELGAEPSAIGIHGDVLLAVVGDRLRAWSIDGVPLDVVVADAVQTLVPGPFGARVLLATGELAAPEIDAGRVAGWLDAHPVDPSLGRLFSATPDAWVGEHGFQSRARDGGPTVASSESLFGAPILAATIDSYYGTTWFAVARADGSAALYRTDPSYQGCD